MRRLPHVSMIGSMYSFLIFKMPARVYDSDMRKSFLLAPFLFFALFPLSALSCEDVTAVNLVPILQEAGYDAVADASGDVEFLDQYDMSYWISIDPGECHLYFSSAWAAADGINSETACRLMNESNRQFFFIRAYYDPVYRVFCCDYDLLYSEDGLDETVFLDFVRKFLDQADIYTDYLMAEGAI